MASPKSSSPLGMGTAVAVAGYVVLFVCPSSCWPALSVYQRRWRRYECYLQRGGDLQLRPALKGCTCSPARSQWECKAEMKKSQKFGFIQVICEGYDFPDDPYVLVGSCGSGCNIWRGIGVPDVVRRVRIAAVSVKKEKSRLNLQARS
ncbi:hypothetical protein HPB48_006191 [Haemaphysalis longicornis]|uniref:Store-operated calcium entry-associated regulatory factor n=1 Tax=Haemaphysalis longicornis TaxID=44386 RepID=A0A9J6FT54_HAELO|nr:hypothetical protein HPB48_006191 [Haemaphysalis longicornis]